MSEMCSRQRTPFVAVAGFFKFLRSLDDAYCESNGDVEQDFCFGRAEQLARVVLTFRIRGEAAMSVRSFLLVVSIGCSAVAALSAAFAETDPKSVSHQRPSTLGPRATVDGLGRQNYR
jgi:hypothetical protein